MIVSEPNTDKIGHGLTNAADKIISN